MVKVSIPITYAIILPIKVKLGVIDINIIDVCSECQRHLAASFPNNIDVVRGFVLKELVLKRILE